MNLYEINAEIRALIDEETGEVLDYEKFVEANLSLEEKKENIALYIKNLTAEASAIKEEKDRLAERETAKRNRADKLKDYLCNFLGGEKFETAKVTCSFRKSVVCEIENEAEFLSCHPEFAKPQPAKLSLSDVKDALKNGEVIVGASLIEKMNLQIK